MDQFSLRLQDRARQVAEGGNVPRHVSPSMQSEGKLQALTVQHPHHPLPQASLPMSSPNQDQALNQFSLRLQDRARQYVDRDHAPPDVALLMQGGGASQTLTAQTSQHMLAPAQDQFSVRLQDRANQAVLHSVVLPPPQVPGHLAAHTQTAVQTMQRTSVQTGTHTPIQALPEPQQEGGWKAHLGNEAQKRADNMLHSMRSSNVATHPHSVTVSPAVVQHAPNLPAAVQQSRPHDGWMQQIQNTAQARAAMISQAVKVPTSVGAMPSGYAPRPTRVRAMPAGYAPPAVPAEHFPTYYQYQGQRYGSMEDVQRAMGR